jgi:septum formation protein
MLGVPFTVRVSLEGEIYPPGLSPRETAEAIAAQKVRSVAGLTDGRWIFGADTIVTIDGLIFGKPKDRNDARRMIALLQGQTHEVITAIVLSCDSGFACRSVVSSVEFAPMTDAEIDWYISSGEWEGAAGAYKVQGVAGCFVSNIKGSYSNIVGLPLHETYALFKESGYWQ